MPILHPIAQCKMGVTQFAMCIIAIILLYWRVNNDTNHIVQVAPTIKG